MWGDISPRSGGSSAQEVSLDTAGPCVVCRDKVLAAPITRSANIFPALTKYFLQEILRNGLDKSVSGVTHLDLAAHGTVSLSRCSTLKPTSGSVHSLPSAQVSQEYQTVYVGNRTAVWVWVSVIFIFHCKSRNYSF